MKDINISKTIADKRREKGVTQDQLAAYIGVSKASVSKWETGQSYPDITFLLQLASYFNISIDDLMGYTPQMTKENIKELYHRLSSDFSNKPFDDVLAECRKIIKKYYSCFPLLMQMAVLMCNHHMLAKSVEEQKSILEDAAGLCIRIKNESGDVWLAKDAVSLEATCYLMLRQPQNVQLQNEQFEEILHRILCVAEVFDLDRLHPNSMALTYLSAAQGYSIQGDDDKALDMLERYTVLCTTGLFPYSLHGDSFFNELDSWFKEFDLGAEAPRSEEVIKQSMIQGIIHNPAFAPLIDHPKYKSCIKTLKSNLGGS